MFDSTNVGTYVANAVNLSSISLSFVYKIIEDIVVVIREID